MGESAAALWMLPKLQLTKGSLSALPILNEVRELMDGFEVVQGSMDDVFLNACSN